MIVDRVADGQRAVALAEDVIVLVRLAAMCEAIAAKAASAATRPEISANGRVLAARCAGGAVTDAALGHGCRAAMPRSDRARASARRVDALKGKRSEVALTRKLFLIGKERHLTAGRVENLGLAQPAQFRIVAGGKELALSSRTL